MRLTIIILLLYTFTLHTYSQDPNRLFENIDSLENFYMEELKKGSVLSPRKLQVSEDEVLKFTDRLPSFGVYKDTYFITGVPLNKKIDKTTADVEFQISIRQRLTKSILPFNSFLYLTYTQKSFWDLYAESSPFRDSNYNPGLGLGKYIIRDNKLEGACFVQVEHESNGRDSLESRSWNYLSFSAKYFFSMRISLQLELWLPYVDGGENKDLSKYKGYGTFSANYISPNNLWWLSADINPREGFGNVNVTLGAGFRISQKSNQYLYAQFYNGYAEGLLDYNKFSSYLRVGLCIKPDFYSIF